MYIPASMMDGAVFPVTAAVSALLFAGQIEVILTCLAAWGSAMTGHRGPAVI